MISGIRGSIRRFGASTVHIEAGGVEYEIHVPLPVFNLLQRDPREGVIFLHVYHHFVQEEQRLFGFQTSEQRELFIALKSIKGLGTSLALSLLSHLDGPELLAVCERKDQETLCRIPRIGRRTAETVLFEINRRLDRWKKILLPTGDEGMSVPATESPEQELACQALLQLGYREKEARAALRAVAAREDIPDRASELIRAALREF